MAVRVWFHYGIKRSLAHQIWRKIPIIPQFLVAAAVFRPKYTDKMGKKLYFCSQNKAIYEIVWAILERKERSLGPRFG